jgi:hypothetical protein
MEDRTDYERNRSELEHRYANPEWMKDNVGWVIGDRDRANNRQHLQRRPPENRFHPRRRHHGSEHPAANVSNAPSATFTGIVSPTLLPCTWPRFGGTFS